MTRIAQVDAFTAEAFRGNPAGVCILDEVRDAAWMQRVAAEMNLAETAFLQPGEDGFGLRWFTPQVEVDLCGHATLASAHVLWESKRLPPSELVRFHTKSGLLTAARRGAWIELDFPRRRKSRPRRRRASSRPWAPSPCTSAAAGSTTWRNSIPKRPSPACGRTSRGWRRFPLVA